MVRHYSAALAHFRAALDNFMDPKGATCFDTQDGCFFLTFYNHVDFNINQIDLYLVVF